MTKTRVEVSYHSPVKEIVGKGADVITLEGEATVFDLVGLLSEKYGNRFRAQVVEEQTCGNFQPKLDPKSCKLRGGLVVFVNSRHADLTTCIQNEDKVVFMAVICGG